MQKVNKIENRILLIRGIEDKSFRKYLVGRRIRCEREKNMMEKSSRILQRGPLKTIRPNQTTIYGKFVAILNPMSGEKCVEIGKDLLIY